MATVTDTDLGYRALLASFPSLRRVQVLVGILDDPELAPIAAFNEFGTDTIPERSFLRSTVDENRTKYGTAMGAAIVDVLVRGQTVEQAFGGLGELVQFDIQDKIEAIDHPRNAPSTIAKKGFDDPLIETGILHDSIDFEVLS